jgi:hypothetical protein
MRTLALCGRSCCGCCFRVAALRRVAVMDMARVWHWQDARSGCRRGRPLATQPILFTPDLSRLRLLPSSRSLHS